MQGACKHDAKQEGHLSNARLAQQQIYYWVFSKISNSQQYYYTTGIRTTGEQPVLTINKNKLPISKINYCRISKFWWHNYLWSMRFLYNESEFFCMCVCACARSGGIYNMRRLRYSKWLKARVPVCWNEQATKGHGGTWWLDDVTVMWDHRQAIITSFTVQSVSCQRRQVLGQLAQQNAMRRWHTVSLREQ